MKAFEYMVDQNINTIKPDLLVIAGDIFDTYDPSNDVRAFFNAQLSRLVDCKVPVIILVGNHDICKKNHALSPIANINVRNIKVIEEPKMIQFKGHLLMLYPYSLSVERSIVSQRKLFADFVEESKKKIADNEALQGNPILFFGHFGVKGAKLNAGLSVAGKKMDFKNSSSHDITINDLDSIGADYVFLGDYHEHQILPTKNCVAMYTGSVEKDDITQREQPKGFVVYDTEVCKDAEYGKVRFVEYPHCRPMVALSGSVKDIQAGIDKLTDDDMGAAVRIVYMGDTKGLNEFSLSIDDMRHQIRQKIKPVHIYDSQKVTDTETVEKGKKLEQDIIERGHMSEDEVVDVVNSIIAELAEEDEISTIQQMALEIRKEAKEV
jgi:DNA repair exonuclease SbcCD nuclease subunit